MKTNVLLILFIIFSINLRSQQMTEFKLKEIITTVSDSVSGQEGNFQFYIEDIAFICLSDVKNNRMRVISPIIEVEKLDEELKTLLLMANFHTALDARYSIANGILWSTFLHPLIELSDTQLIDAIKQVYSANKNFGTSFSSTELVFPLRIKDDENDQNKDNETFKKQRF